LQWGCISIVRETVTQRIVIENEQHGQEDDDAGADEEDAYEDDEEEGEEGGMEEKGGRRPQGARAVVPDRSDPFVRESAIAAATAEADGAGDD
jgi:hypothetical protein